MMRSDILITREMKTNQIYCLPLSSVVLSGNKAGITLERLERRATIFKAEEGSVCTVIKNWFYTVL